MTTEQDKKAIETWEKQRGFVKNNNQNTFPKFSEGDKATPLKPKASSTAEVNKYISLAKQMNNNNSPLESSLGLMYEAYGEIVIDFAALMQLKLAEFEALITVPNETHTAEQGYEANNFGFAYDAWIEERIEFWDSFAETLRGWAKLAEGSHMSGFTNGCVSTLLDLANLFDAINALEPKEVKSNNKQPAIFFCPTHYKELQQRWKGKLQDAYPGSEIQISDSKCDYFNCTLVKPSKTQKPIKRGDSIKLRAYGNEIITRVFLQEDEKHVYICAQEEYKKAIQEHREPVAAGWLKEFIVI